MVDIHSHLVPAIDDGISDSQQALTCLTQLAEWGIQKIITTPHVSGDRYPTATATLRKGQYALQTQIDDYGLPLSVSVAAEYLIDDHFVGLLQQGDLLSFGSRRYLLVETGWAGAPNQLSDILFRIQTYGYTPVLAHPERYRYYHRHRKSLLELRETGCLFQLNWMSLTGRYGVECQKQARFLMQERVVDFIGSDMHRPGDIVEMARLFNSADFKLLREQPLLNASLFQETDLLQKDMSWPEVQ